MLGDFVQHQQPLPYYSVLEVLNTWVSLVKQGADVDRHIVLVLEKDSVDAGLLKEFIKTNDLKPLFNYWFFSAMEPMMEDLEFFADIRRLSIKVDSLNAVVPEQMKVTFDILGPEATLGFVHAEPGPAFKNEMAEFILHERDSLIARTIIEYLAQHKESKAVAFYGSAHLNKSFTRKYLGVKPNRPDTLGFWLAHYLKRAYGEQRVLSVNQMLFNPRIIKPAIVKKAGKENFYIESNALAGVPGLDSVYDGVIVRREPFVSSHSIHRIFSVNVVNAFISKMDSLLYDSTNRILKRDYLTALRALPYLCGVNFENPLKPEAWFKSDKPAIVLNQWKAWLAKNASAIPQRMDSKEFKGFLKQLYAQSFHDGKLRGKLLSIGFGLQAWNVHGFSESQWDSLIWPEAISRIKCINAIGQFWFGDSTEQTMGHDFLVQYTGKNLSEPDLYLKWFRNRKDSVSY